MFSGHILCRVKQIVLSPPPRPPSLPLLPPLFPPPSISVSSLSCSSSFLSSSSFFSSSFLHLHFLPGLFFLYKDPACTLYQSLFCFKTTYWTQPIFDSWNRQLVLGSISGSGCIYWRLRVEKESLQTLRLYGRKHRNCMEQIIPDPLCHPTSSHEIPGAEWPTGQLLSPTPLALGTLNQSSEGIYRYLKTRIQCQEFHFLVCRGPASWLIW